MLWFGQLFFFLPPLFYIKHRDATSSVSLDVLLICNVIPCTKISAILFKLFQDFQKRLLLLKCMEVSSGFNKVKIDEASLPERKGAT